jgi:hypothetical protein
MKVTELASQPDPVPHPLRSDEAIFTKFLIGIAACTMLSPSNIRQHVKSKLPKVAGKLQDNEDVKELKPWAAANGARV